MQATTVAMETHVFPMLNALSQEGKMLKNPVLDRLIKEVQNNNITMAYDRVHNRHNRGR